MGTRKGGEDRHKESQTERNERKKGHKGDFRGILFSWSWLVKRRYVSPNRYFIPYRLSLENFVQFCRWHYSWPFSSRSFVSVSFCSQNTSLQNTMNTWSRMPRWNFGWPPSRLAQCRPRSLEPDLRSMISEWGTTDWSRRSINVRGNVHSIVTNRFSFISFSVRIFLRNKKNYLSSKEIFSRGTNSSKLRNRNCRYGEGTCRYAMRFHTNKKWLIQVVERFKWICYFWLGTQCEGF